tara:strand:- start:842 stop:988 length:147 start_codon:yes stop_codon:yes gene_type:complete
VGIIIFLSIGIAAFLLLLIAAIHYYQFRCWIEKAEQAAKEDPLEEPLM